MSFATRSARHTSHVSPLTPLIDVLFLLLIFFMTASVFREQDQMINVDLAATESSDGVARPQDITITIQKRPDGDAIFIGMRQYDYEQLRRQLTEWAGEFTDANVTIRPDETSTSGTLTRVMDIAKVAGLNVTLATTRLAGRDDASP